MIQGIQVLEKKKGKAKEKRKTIVVDYLSRISAGEASFKETFGGAGRGGFASLIQHVSIPKGKTTAWHQEDRDQGGRGGRRR